MLPTKIESQPGTYHFGQLGHRQVIADFSGGQITSDGGLVLIAQFDRYYRITERFARCFEDHRDPKRVQHSLNDLIAQRVYGLVQGYEDLNDHDCLRTDPMFGIAVGKLESQHPRCAPLAGKSTLNRLEQAKSPAMMVRVGFAAVIAEELRGQSLAFRPPAVDIQSNDHRGSSIMGTPFLE